MEIIIKIIGISCLVILFNISGPTLRLRKLIFDDYYYDDWGRIKRFIFELISCSGCLSFWVALVITQNLYYAAISSILSFLIDKKLTN